MITSKKSIFRISRKDRDGFSVLEVTLASVVIVLAGIVAILGYENSTQSPVVMNKVTPPSSTPSNQPVTSEAVSDKFVEAMFKGDAGVAYQLTSPDYRALTNQTQTQTTFDGIKAKISKKPIKLSGQTPNQKSYQYTAQGAEGPQALVIRMQSVDNKWLVYGFQLYDAQL